jgi:hypothetical protein
MKEFIYEKSGSLSLDICAELIQYFEANYDKQYDGILGTSDDTTTLVNEDIKKSIDLSFPILSEETDDTNMLKLQKHLISELTNSLKLYYNRLDPSGNTFFFNNIHNGLLIDSFLFHKYLKNNSHFSYHNDFYVNTSNKTTRVFNFIWYLNDVLEGGETEFFGSHQIKPQAGKLVIFPSEWIFPHCGKIPISNDKYIIAGWIYKEFFI